MEKKECNNTFIILVPTISLAHMADIQQALNYQVHLMRIKPFRK